ncbi:MAG: tannase/feruloyl esterase family alpha/beta hydrolase [Terracidiphilus sp.]
MRSVWTGLVVLAVVAGQGLAARAADCAGLAKLKLGATTITRAEAVTQGSLETDGQMERELPALCRVEGVLRPSSDSEIRFEVWMPESGWNGRLLGVGNGGFAGSIGYGEMAGYLKRGYAVAGSDAGHEAEAADGSWAYGHPEKVKDFGWRAVHATRERAGELVRAYYGKPQEKAYFDSCSDGGREALMEAQRFPEDYDGILAGAPANAWSTLTTAGVAEMQMLMNDPRSYVPPRKLKAIEDAALAACDAADGVKDGVIEDPTQCHFDPAVLACKSTDTNECLTPAQVQAVKGLYGGAVDDSGKPFFYGMEMGDETAWRLWVVGDDPGASLGAQFARNNFRYLVTGDPKWNVLTADVDAALKESRAKTAADLDSTDPDLSRFAARGGKLILYHGWNDPAIPPGSTVAYYKSVEAKLGAAKTAGFARLYMIPGMEHCMGGPGASVFGQFGVETAKGPKYGVMDELTDWVEQGKPDEPVIATKYAAGPDGAQKAVMTRPLCAYPTVARYKGAGDATDADNYACVAP